MRPASYNENVTIDERLGRIEQITAGVAEEHRNDREENRQLWCDTQRQIGELANALADTNRAVVRFAEESRAADKWLGERIDEVDKRLGDRIDSLISAIGEMLRGRNGGVN